MHKGRSTKGPLRKTKLLLQRTPGAHRIGKTLPIGKPNHGSNHGSNRGCATEHIADCLETWAWRRHQPTTKIQQTTINNQQPRVLRPRGPAHLRCKLRCLIDGQQTTDNKHLTINKQDSTIISNEESTTATNIMLNPW